MKIAFYTLGCRLNKAESDSFARGFSSRGFEVVEFSEPADVYVFNTCAVTVSAVRKSRQAINKVKKRNHAATIVATGCSIEQEKIVDFFAQEKSSLVEDVCGFLEKQNKLFLEQDLAKEPTYLSDRTRAMVKVQDGCDVFCTYCIIARRRGPLKSVDPDEVVAEINQFASQGFQEVSLSGVNINRYGFKQDDGSVMDLYGLIEYVLEHTDILRIRFGSMDPGFIDDAFIDLWEQHDRLCNHWHISLQSGSDSVLEAMHRGYSREQFMYIVRRLREIDPLFGFTTDVIVGFPGETEEDFALSKSIVEQVQFLHVHVFPFSPRPATPAFYSKEQLPEDVKKQRAAELRAVARKVGRKFRNSAIGSNDTVLLEDGDLDSGVYQGYTGNYLRVSMKSPQNIQNTVQPVTLSEEHFVPINV